MAGDLHKGEGLREIAGAAAARGSFSFDPDELQSLIRKWEELAQSYDDSSVEAELMCRIKAPGDDFASKGHAAILRRPVRFSRVDGKDTGLFRLLVCGVDFNRQLLVKSVNLNL